MDNCASAGCPWRRRLPQLLRHPGTHLLEHVHQLGAHGADVSPSCCVILGITSWNMCISCVPMAQTSPAAAASSWESPPGTCVSAGCPWRRRLPQLLRHPGNHLLEHVHQLCAHGADVSRSCCVILGLTSWNMCISWVPMAQTSPPAAASSWYSPPGTCVSAGCPWRRRLPQLLRHPGTHLLEHVHQLGAHGADVGEDEHAESTPDDHLVRGTVHRVQQVTQACGVRHDRVRHGRVRHDRVRHGRVRHGRVGHDRVRHGRVRHGRVRHGRVRDPPTAVRTNEINVKIYVKYNCLIFENFCHQIDG